MPGTAKAKPLTLVTGLPQLTTRRLVFHSSLGVSGDFERTWTEDDSDPVRDRPARCSWVAMVAGSIVLGIALAAIGACVPAPRAGRDDLSAGAGSGRDGAGMSRIDGGVDWGDWARAGDHGDGGMSIPDGGAGARGPAADAEPEAVVLGSASIAGGGALVVRARDGGFEFVLDAAGSAARSVEPLGRLAGPELLSAYFGPGCRSAAAGEAMLLARWTGEIRRCATVVRPAAVLVAPGSQAASGCQVDAAPAGSYELSVWPCGSYDAPLGVVQFEVEAPAEEVDAGPGGGPGGAAGL
jgi:hypothetical protein